jgi:hypothetical protein
MEYRVAWEIDVEADSPREAAEKAREIMQAPKTEPDSANVFQVLESWQARKGPDMFRDFAETIDLEEPELVRVDDLKPGDMVDLYGDKYADPDCNPAEGLEFESALVETVKPAEPVDGVPAVLVYTFSVNFKAPVDHKVKRTGRDAEAAAAMGDS